MSDGESSPLAPPGFEPRQPSAAAQPPPSDDETPLGSLFKVRKPRAAKRPRPPPPPPLRGPDAGDNDTLAAIFRKKAKGTPKPAKTAPWLMEVKSQYKRASDTELGDSLSSLFQKDRSTPKKPRTRPGDAHATVTACEEGGVSSSSIDAPPGFEKPRPKPVRVVGTVKGFERQQRKLPSPDVSSDDEVCRDAFIFKPRSKVDEEGGDRGGKRRRSKPISCLISDVEAEDVGVNGSCVAETATERTDRASHGEDQIVKRRGRKPQAGVTESREVGAGVDGQPIQFGHDEDSGAVKKGRNLRHDRLAEMEMATGVRKLPVRTANDEDSGAVKKKGRNSRHDRLVEMDMGAGVNERPVRAGHDEESATVKKKGRNSRRVRLTGMEMGAGVNEAMHRDSSDGNFGLAVKRQGRIPRDNPAMETKVRSGDDQHLSTASVDARLDPVVSYKSVPQTEEVDGDVHMNDVSHDPVMGLVVNRNGGEPSNGSNAVVEVVAIRDDVHLDRASHNGLLEGRCIDAEDLEGRMSMDGKFASPHDGGSIGQDFRMQGKKSLGNQIVELEGVVPDVQKGSVDIEDFVNGTSPNSSIRAEDPLSCVVHQSTSFSVPDDRLESARLDHDNGFCMLSERDPESSAPLKSSSPGYVVEPKERGVTTEGGTGSSSAYGSNLIQIPNGASKGMSQPLIEETNLLENGLKHCSIESMDSLTHQVAECSLPAAVTAMPTDRAGCEPCAETLIRDTPQTFGAISSPVEHVINELSGGTCLPDQDSSTVLSNMLDESLGIGDASDQVVDVVPGVKPLFVMERKEATGLSIDDQLSDLGAEQVNNISNTSNACLNLISEAAVIELSAQPENLSSVPPEYNKESDGPLVRSFENARRSPPLPSTSTNSDVQALSVDHLPCSSGDNLPFMTYGTAKFGSEQDPYSSEHFKKEEDTHNSMNALDEAAIEDPISMSPQTPVIMQTEEGNQFKDGLPQYSHENLSGTGFQATQRCSSHDLSFSDWARDKDVYNYVEGVKQPHVPVSGCGNKENDVQSCNNAFSQQPRHDPISDESLVSSAPWQTEEKVHVDDGLPPPSGVGLCFMTSQVAKQTCPASKDGCKLLPAAGDSTEQFPKNAHETIQSSARSQFIIKEGNTVCSPIDFSDANETIAASVSDHEETDNQPMLQRGMRNIRKRRHGDMTYEGDEDWDVNENPAILDELGDNVNESSAIVTAGLKISTVVPMEKLKFKELLKRRSGLQEYMECRNMIISLWSRDVKHILPLADCGVSVVPSENEVPRASLIREVYKFLDSNGYINTGIASEKQHPLLYGSSDSKLPMEINPEKTPGVIIDCSNEPTVRKSIIVVGAGPAGLAAARHLYRQGFSVTVLEARDRIGGRVYTDRSSLSVPVDLGASIITGIEADIATERRPDPSSLISSQLGLELTVLNSGCPLYDIVTGNKVPAVLDEDVDAEFNNLLDDMVLFIEQNGETAMRMSLEDGLEYTLRRRFMGHSTTVVTDTDKLSKEASNCGMAVAFTNTSGDTGTGYDSDSGVRRNKLTSLERRVMDWHFAHLEYGFAAPLKEVSLPNWNQDEAYGGFGGAHCMIQGGFSNVVESIGKGLDIRLNEAVTEVMYNLDSDVTGKQQSKVKLITSNGGEFAGDAVLITVPLGCLKADSIKFSPILPEWKRSSIRRLGFGVINKVVLEFPAVFWDDTLDYFGVTAEETNHRGHCFMFWNVKKTVRAPVLIALVAGKAAIDGQTMSASDHVNHALVALRKLFGATSVPDPVASVVTNWGVDPFSRGAYTYVAIGASGEDCDILGRPVSNCLFFAGEATCKEYPDTVGGAMMSGVREAVRIIDVLSTGKDYVAEVEAMEYVQRHSESERNEVRDMSKRLEACKHSYVLCKNSSEVMSKEALLHDMFLNAKTTPGRLYLAKELLRLPKESLKSFAGTKEGLGILNSWILDSLGKNATQLLRHCVRLLVVVSTDLVAVRFSGIGRTLKQKVCVHTSRDIRAIASQLVNMWMDIFRKEKTDNSRLKLLRQTSASVPSKVKSKDILPRKQPVCINEASDGRGNMRPPSTGNRSPPKANSKKSDNKTTRLASLVHIKPEVKSSHPQSMLQKSDYKAEDSKVLSKEQAAAFTAAKAARAAALAASEARASSEAEVNPINELPKILSFHKFVRRDQYMQMDDSDLRRKLPGSITVRQDCLPELDSRNCKVRNWPVGFPATCTNIVNSKMTGDVNTQSILANDTAGPSSTQEHSGEAGAIDNRPTKAWVDVDSASGGGVKDSFAIDMWQSQAMSADADFYNRVCVKHAEGSKQMSMPTAVKYQKKTDESSRSQAAEQKSSAEGQPRVESQQRVEGGQQKGAEPIKLGVVDYLTSLLMPLYKTKKLDREAYKSIMKKTTTKVMEQCTEAEKAMDVHEFLDLRRKNKIRAYVDKLIERHMSVNPSVRS